VKLHVVYRSTGPGNRKRRPPFFDKLLCLTSLVRSLKEFDGIGGIVFINDGSIPSARLALMRGLGEVVSLPGVGNSNSYRHALKVAIQSRWADDDLVLLSEDDYLYLPSAVGKLATAAREITAASYFSPYDHVDRYRRRDDARSGLSKIWVAGNHHWRSVESTCMSFVARIAALRRDAWVHLAGSTNISPRDRMIWRAVQRLGVFCLFPTQGGGPPRRLVSPIPSLATHVETGQLAPAIDWQRVAEDAAAWAQRAGIDLPEDRA
jgi:hypothetical protein